MTPTLTDRSHLRASRERLMDLVIHVGILRGVLIRDIPGKFSIDGDEAVFSMTALLNDVNQLLRYMDDLDKLEGLPALYGEPAGSP